MLSGMRQATMVALAAALFGALWGCGGENFTQARRSNEEGMRLYSEKMYGDAAGAFRNAVRQDPRDYHSFFYLGVCYEEMKQHQQAFQAYYTALEVMNETQEGKFDQEFRLTVLDTLASAIARHDETDVELDKAEKTAKATQKAENWFLLAKVYRLRGDPDMAIDAYRRACHFDSWSFPIRKEFGLYLLDPLNQSKDAEYYLRQAYRLEPNDNAVNAALDRLGVTPLPAYKAKEEAARPVTPKGPVVPALTPTVPSLNGATVQTPRD